jgi:hypothetical protein
MAKNKRDTSKWFEIKGFDGIYKMTVDGRIKSITRYVDRKNWKPNCSEKFLVKGKELIITKSSEGYLTTSLFKNGEKIGVKLHRLIAIHFIPNPENKPFINHINGIRDDNRLENLEWVTIRENGTHGKISITKTSKYTGVSICRRSGRWKAYASLNKKSTFLGRYDTEQEANQAYKNALSKHGEFNKYA